VSQSVREKVYGVEYKLQRRPLPDIRRHRQRVRIELRSAILAAAGIRRLSSCQTSHQLSNTEACR
jgi:hypothetical protein